MYKIVVRKRAANDVKEAYQWYEEKQIGLGDLFLKEIQDCYNKLEKNPSAYHKVKFNFRQFNFKKFPYVVVYDIKNDLVIVYTVFHTKRDPKNKFRL